MDKLKNLGLNPKKAIDISHNLDFLKRLQKEQQKFKKN